MSVDIRRRVPTGHTVLFVCFCCSTVWFVSCLKCIIISFFLIYFFPFVCVWVHFPHFIRVWGCAFKLWNSLKTHSSKMKFCFMNRNKKAKDKETLFSDLMFRWHSTKIASRIHLEMKQNIHSHTSMQTNVTIEWWKYLSCNVPCNFGSLKINFCK